MKREEDGICNCRLANKIILIWSRLEYNIMPISFKHTVKYQNMYVERSEIEYLIFMHSFTIQPLSIHPIMLVRVQYYPHHSNRNDSMCHPARLGLLLTTTVKYLIWLLFGKLLKHETLLVWNLHCTVRSNPLKKLMHMNLTQTVVH